jgi:hypothetical protein
MTWLDERGVHPITVDVLAGNDDAQRLYARYGFHPRTVRMRHIKGPMP